jgi:hypothetical protein
MKHNLIKDITSTTEDGGEEIQPARAPNTWLRSLLALHTWCGVVVQMLYETDAEGHAIVADIQAKRAQSSSVDVYLPRLCGEEGGRAPQQHPAAEGAWARCIHGV